MCLVVICTWSVGVAAAPIAVVNSGFEDISGESPVDEFTFGPLNGWSLYDPSTAAGGGTYFIGTLTPTEIGVSGVFINFSDGAFEVDRVGIAFNSAGSDVANDGGEYGLEQTLADTLQANTQYTLKVAIGNIASGISGAGTFFQLSGFPGYRVELLAGGEVIAIGDAGSAGPISDGEFGLSRISIVLEQLRRIGVHGA